MRKATATKITEAQYSAALTDYVKADARKQTITAKCNEEVAKVNNKYKDELDSLAKQLIDRYDIVKSYCEQNREQLFSGVQSIKVNTIKIGFRKGTCKIVTCEGVTMDDVLVRLKKKKLNDYVRTTEEVDKQKLIADSEEKKIVSALPALGIKFVQEETFFITPSK